jgi:membrane protease YdiL (CAAX protease family)
VYSPARVGAMTRILLGCLVMFAVIQFGPGWLASRFDQTWSFAIATAVMLGVALLLGRVFFASGPAATLRDLGFGRPPLRALAVAAVVTLVMLAFFPVFAAATGADISLKADWWWILAGAVALNGIGEEALFRGYVFGGLRRAGLSFARAGGVSLVVFALVHLFLFVQNAAVIAVLGTLVAVASAFPLAYLFEHGARTLWAPVVVHVGTHAIRMVDVSEPYAQTALIAWIALQVATPCVVFLFHGILTGGRRTGDSVVHAG